MIFFFQAEDGIRDSSVTGVQTCALPIVAFAAVMNAVALPIWIAVGGIVLRGAGFAFRKEAHGIGVQRALRAVFASSSLLTPFFMGPVIGPLAAGQEPPHASRASPPALPRATSPPI